MSIISAKSKSIFNTIALSESKLKFLKQSYFHLLLSIFIFVALEILYFQTGIAKNINDLFSGIPWLAILGIYMILAWIGRHFANKLNSRLLQYSGMILYILVKSIIFIPLLYQAEIFASKSIQYAAQFTIAAFTLLTLIVFLTKKDFSFLRTFLYYAGILSLIIIVASFFLQFSLGVWFDLAMVILGGTGILYDTSNILLRYSHKNYVSAALELFASMMLIFWYSLRFIRRFSK